jgi:catechol 2,3-dioxygenase-like lactoylglutathione lyase family enzyme
VNAEPHRALVHLAIVVRDYDEAIAWYTQVLDFDLIQDVDLPDENKRWVVVAPKGSRECSLLLARASKPEQEPFIGRQAGGRVFLFLNTDDFRRDYEMLRARGVRFIREPKTAPYGTVAVFEDLYGNLWDLIQLEPGHPVAQRLTRG